MCEMLTSYYRERVAGAEQIQDDARFNEAYEKWRGNLTWSEIQHLRDSYWTKSKRNQVRAKASH